MRKIIVAVLAILCLLTACSQPEATPRDNVGKITYAGVCLADGENTPYRQQLEKELLRLGYYVNFVDAKGDQAVQHDQITGLIEAQYDVLVVEPVMAAATDVILTRLKTASIPVVLLGKEQTEDVLSLWPQACYVGFDQSQPGLVQGQIILNTDNRGDINGDGQVTYAVLAGPEGNIYTGLHIENCTVPLQEADIQLQLLDVVYGDHTQERGKALTEGLLSRFGRDIEVLFCGSDAMAMGALEALKQSGRTVNQDIYVVGIGGEAEVLSDVSQGLLTGTAMADHNTLAQQAAQAASLLLQKSADKIYMVDYVLKETP